MLLSPTTPTLTSSGATPQGLGYDTDTANVLYSLLCPHPRSIVVEVEHPVMVAGHVAAWLYNTTTQVGVEVSWLCPQWDDATSLIVEFQKNLRTHLGRNITQKTGVLNEWTSNRYVVRRRPHLNDPSSDANIQILIFQSPHVAHNLQLVPTGVNSLQNIPLDVLIAGQPHPRCKEIGEGG